MSTARSVGQKLLAISVDSALIDEIDAGVPKSGAGSRSEFIRQAVVEKLSKLGIEIPAELIAAPSRAGKGGRPSHSNPSKTPTKSMEYSVLHAPRVASAEEENPFLAEDIERAASSGSGGGLRRDPGGFQPGPGESGSGSSALRRQKISTKEPIQGVSKEAADAALDGALTAQRMQREGHLSRPARKSGAPSGSTGEQSPFAPAASGQPGAASGRARGRSGSGAAASSAKAPPGGGSKAVRGN